MKTGDGFCPRGVAAAGWAEYAKTLIIRQQPRLRQAKPGRRKSADTTSTYATLLMLRVRAWCLKCFYPGDAAVYAPAAFSQSRQSWNSAGLADATTERSHRLAISKLPDRLDNRPPASSRISAPAA